MKTSAIVTTESPPSHATRSGSTHMGDARPQAAALQMLQETAAQSPRATGLNTKQLLAAQGFKNRLPTVLQAKTDVKENLNDGDDTKTANKKINTPTQGEKWFRFAKDGNKINSFANNITTKAPAGGNPVTKTVDLANYPSVDTGEISSMTRPTHFSMGDKLANISSDDRTGTWTWHHKIDAYKMELVDMYAHGGFYHYGGFSQWDMDEDDSDD